MDREVYRRLDMKFDDLGLDKTLYESLILNAREIRDYAERLYNLEGGPKYLGAHVAVGVGPYTITINTTPGSRTVYELGIKIPIKGIPLSVNIKITEQDIENMRETGEKLRDFVRGILQTYLPQFRKEMKEVYERRLQETKPEASNEEKVVLSVVAILAGLTLINVLTAPEKTARAVSATPSMIATIIGVGTILLISLGLLYYKRKSRRA